MNENITLRKQEEFIKFIKTTQNSRLVFSILKDENCNIDTFVPKIGMTLGQFFTYLTLGQRDSH
jgi:hypothetical protein